MSPEAVYWANKSMTGETARSVGFPLAYGSAELHGFKFRDTICLNPMNFTSLDQVTPKALNSHFCVKNFKY